MDFNEENPNNPTISAGMKLNVQHFFQIKYKTKDMKDKMIDLILRLVKEHEISDFFIDEKPAYERNRILYNYHTLVSEEGNIGYSELEDNFLKMLK